MPIVKYNIWRERKAKKIIQRRVLYAAGLGFIPIPILDVASIFTTQVLMVKNLARLYKVPFTEHRIDTFIGVMLGDLGTASVLKSIPGLGSFLGGTGLAMSGAAATFAIGSVFHVHFRNGGSLLDFEPENYDKQLREYYKEKTIKRGIRKALKARRTKMNHNLLTLIFIMSFLLAVGGFYYLNFDTQRLFTISESTLISKQMKAKVYNLEAIENLDENCQEVINNFEEYSTEEAIARYIQNENSAYPKMFALSAVRFKGNSTILSLTGAEKQLFNISCLMKKYPDLVVNFYCHTTDIGPVFHQRRIGRERARILVSYFDRFGIPGSRITGTYVEKHKGINFEYWGADILIDASIESAKVAKVNTKNTLRLW